MSEIGRIRRAATDGAAIPGERQVSSRPVPAARLWPQLAPALLRRSFALGDRFAERYGPSPRPLTAEALIERAQRQTRLDDFGEFPFARPLTILLESLDREAALSLFGRLALRWDCLRFLTNLLQLREAEKRERSILRETISQPIFIAGLPRSGTTFLHRLFAQDPGNRIVRCCETIYPDAARGDAAADIVRRRKVDRQLSLFAALAPGFSELHPIDADAPQECTEITAHLFTSLRFDTTHHVPSYRAWLDRTDTTPAYRFHRRFLQHLQWQKGRGQWVLKCPDHLFALSTIRRVYPDARFVFLHRDPLEVLASVTRLTEILRRPFTRRLDLRQLGRQVSQHWALGAAILMVGAEPDAVSEDVIHLRFRDLVQDPLATVATIYDRFGLDWTDTQERHMRSYVAARPNGGYGRNQARLEDFGLDGETERRRFRDYSQCFGVGR
jgi:hypothetical protein